MGDERGFLKAGRSSIVYRPICERVQDFLEVSVLPENKALQKQASRCMDCSTPFCHWACPLGNYIPEWNDHIYRGNWRAAFELLEETNNLPEITGRVCPGLCEYSCVLGVNDDPVNIRENEFGLSEYGLRKGFAGRKKHADKSGRSVAVIGSGPAGLSCAAQLSRVGHKVIVFERDSLPGGILRYGIPDFKLEKQIIDRRIRILKEQGVVFKTNMEVGVDLGVRDLVSNFDAVVLAGGSHVPRDLNIEGRGLKGIYFAMEYLTQSNRRVSGVKFAKEELIDGKGKKVVIIGGGDTGSDCVGTAHRQGASCVVQIEVLPQPPLCRNDKYPWPEFPLLLKNSSSHQEGGNRYWSVITKGFKGRLGRVNKLCCVRADFSALGKNGCQAVSEVQGSDFEIEADLVIIAVGFLHPEHKGLLTDLGIKFDGKGNVKTDTCYMTSVKKVFCAGDMRRGQSLVVWAIAEGRRAAYFVDRYLMGESNLPLI